MKARLTRERGSALIEFALSFFLIFSVFSGIFQFAYSFYVYNALVAAVREGARYASLKPYDSTNTTPSAQFLTAVQNMVVYGNASPAEGAVPLVPGLRASNVALTVTGGGTGTLTAPSQMTVTISGFTVNAVFGTWNITGKPTCTFPYTGILTPP
ncbi:MAG TPA: TadE family protein [Bryobacteraceae bacterium]|nr:TadE family protein [Bryobacteraceae bacterium]